MNSRHAMFRGTICSVSMLLLSLPFVPSCRSSSDGTGGDGSGVSGGNGASGGNGVGKQTCARAPGFPLRPPNNPRAAAAAPDGSIIVLMGDSYSSSASRYDVAHNTWTQLPQFPIFGNFVVSGASTETAAYFLVDWYSRFVAGDQGVSLVPFDQASSSWGAEIPVPLAHVVGDGGEEVPVSPDSSQRAAGSGHKIYIAGFFSQVYDETTRTFSPMAQMPFGPDEQDVTFANDGNLYSIAYQNAVYEPATDRWSRFSDSIVGRYANAVAPDDLGRVFAIGGYDPHALGASDEVDVLDVRSRTWSPGPALPYSVGNAVSVAACDGRIYVFGGTHGTQRLDPHTMTWDYAD